MSLMLRCLLLLLLLPFLAGMGTSPFGTAVTLSPLEGTTEGIDPRLLGRWRTAAEGKEPTATVELRRSKAQIDRYEVIAPWYFARPVEGRLVKFKDKDREWTVLEVSVSVRAADTGLLLPARHHFGISFDGNRLVVSLLSVQLGHMALTGGGAHGAEWVRDLETTWAGPVAVVVTDGRDLQQQLVLAARRIRPQWVVTFEREP